ncbi:MAG: hypothetical protein ACYCO9_14660 [Streptosporangiaceae bacterium]
MTADSSGWTIGQASAVVDYLRLRAIAHRDDDSRRRADAPTRITLCSG